jgi:hypothetical protein
MKIRLKAFVIIALLGCLQIAKAQKADTPNLFDSYKSTISFPTQEIKKIVTVSPGNSVEFALSRQCCFSGVITSSIQHYPNLKGL